MKSPAEKERKESAPRRAYSPGEIIARKYEPLPWGPRWSGPFGCPDINELWFISGQSASGFSNVPGVVFLVDPPYLSTEVGTYKMYWRLADYLDVLNVLKGHAFVYFTSNKSSILELCDWMGRNPFLGNPFRECRKVEFNASVNYNSKYTDMMLYTVPDEEQAIAA